MFLSLNISVNAGYKDHPGGVDITRIGTFSSPDELLHNPVPAHSLYCTPDNQAPRL